MYYNSIIVYYKPQCVIRGLLKTVVLSWRPGNNLEAMLPNQEVEISESILLTSNLNVVLVRQLRENMDRGCRSVPHGREDFQPSTECK